VNEQPLEMLDSAQAISLFMNETELVDDISAIERSFESTLRTIGVEHYLYLYLHVPFTHSEPPAVVSNLSEKWIQRYIGDGLYLYDPVLQVALRDVVPLDWSDLQRRHNLSASELQVLEESERHGYAGGLAVPVMGPGPCRAILNLPRTNGSAHQKVSGAQMNSCHLLALHFHSRVRPLLSKGDDSTEDFKITRRELECVLWAARGKTSWETAVILNISEATVNFHLTNAMKKLRVFSRAHAIAKAVGLGLIYV